MIFYLEDNKKWSQLMHFFKTCISGNSNICFLWNNVHGWLLMQNSEYLNNLDSDHLVLLSYFKMNYFSSFVNNRDLGIENATFEMDITRMYQSLRSIRKTTKKVMFSLQKKNSNQSDNTATFVMKIFDEDGILEIYRDVYLNPTLNQNLYFNHIRNLSQDNIICLEIQQNYLKGIKEFKNCILQLKFYDEHIHIESLNGEQDLVLQINKNVCSNYNFSHILPQFDNKNRLLIPPNFLISQIYLSNKFNQTIQLQFGEEVVGGRVIVYMRIKNDAFEIVSAFATVFDIDDQTQDSPSPFNIPLQQPQLQQEDIQPNHIQNANNHNLNNNQRSYLKQITNQQLQEDKQMIAEEQKRQVIQQKRNGIVDKINYQQNNYIQSNDDHNFQQKQKDDDQRNKKKNNNQMIDESQEMAEYEQENRNTDKAMELENVGRNKSNDNRMNNIQNFNKKNVINRNQGMEVEAVENVNIRRLRKNNMVDMEDFDHTNNPYVESDQDEHIDKKGIGRVNNNNNNLKNRESVILQHLQDEFSSIEIQQDANLLFSSAALDSRQLAQQQAARQRQQEIILQTETEINPSDHNQSQQVYHQKYSNPNHKFLTEEKYQQQNSLKKQMIGQQVNAFKINESQADNQRMLNNDGKRKHQQRQGEYINSEKDQISQINRNEMVDEESNSIEEQNGIGEYPRKIQKVAKAHKRQDIHHNVEEQKQQNAVRYNQSIPHNQQSKMFQMSNNINNENNNNININNVNRNNNNNNNNNIHYKPSLLIESNPNKNYHNVDNDVLKNKLFNKNKNQIQNTKSFVGQPNKETPPNKINIDYKFLKPPQKNQMNNIFDEKKQKVIPHKRNQEQNGAANYFESHTVSNHQNIKPNQNSQSDDNISYERPQRSKLLQRNQENLEQLRKEKLHRKAKRVAKNQQGNNINNINNINNNHDGSDFFDNYTVSQLDEDAPSNSIYAKGFFQTPNTRKQKIGVPSPSMLMSQLHSSQRIIQVSNEISNSQGQQQQQQQQHKLLKAKNLFKPNQLLMKEVNGYHHPSMTASENIDKKDIQRLQAAVIVNGVKGIRGEQKENGQEKKKDGILNSYQNPLQTNYNSMNTNQSIQSKDIQSYKNDNNTNQSNHNNMNSNKNYDNNANNNINTAELNSAVQRDRFEQYQKNQNMERQIAGISTKNTQIDNKSSRLISINQNGMKNVQQSVLTDNAKTLTSNIRLSESQTFRTCLESLKPNSLYTFSEPITKQHKQMNQQEQHLQDQQLQQQQILATPVITSSVLTKSIKDNSFNNFLKQNKMKDDFSVFSVKKTPHPSVIQQQQDKLVSQNGLEFQPQIQRITSKQEYINSQSEISQKVAQNKDMKLFH